MDQATVTRDTVSLLPTEASVMTLTLGVAVTLREWYAAPAFLVSGGVTAGVGGADRLRFVDALDPLTKHMRLIAAGG